jgi:hypothetical protein
MEIQTGDRFTDHTFEWEVLTHPADVYGGKSGRARTTGSLEPASWRRSRTISPNRPGSIPRPRLNDLASHET